MTNTEKAEMLKDTIYQLYSKEGRSKSYISKLLEISRYIVGVKIKEWGFPQAEDKRHLNPKNQKLLNNIRSKLTDLLVNTTKTITQISSDCNISREQLYYFAQCDEKIGRALKTYQDIMREKTEKRIDSLCEKSSFNYDYERYPAEVWRPIKGYLGYWISSFGRVRRRSKKYKRYYLLKPEYNTVSGRVYVALTDDNGKIHNLNIARLVGFAFVEGHSSERNTINHKDGNVHNNRADNLEWLSQSENNKHAYDKLNRTHVTPKSKRYFFKKIIYKDKYEFKTIAALARFLNKSETQIRRYLDEPEKHDLKLVS